jgi:ethanolamine utilization protein EutA
MNPQGEVTYVSPVLSPICPVRVGQRLTIEQAKEIAALLVQGLEMAAGLRQPGPLLTALATREAEEIFCLSEAEGKDTLFSFSGGVADCMGHNHAWLAFGDLGPILGQALGDSLLCRSDFFLGQETIRATVIGAGCHSTQLSGSTVFYQNVRFPIRNIPVICPHVGDSLKEEISRKLKQQDGFCVAALPGMESLSYSQVLALAEKIVAGFEESPIFLCLEADMAKVLGQVLALRLGKNARILCLDRISLTEGSFLDVGKPVGPALPVVVKTLVLEA